MKLLPAAQLVCVSLFLSLTFACNNAKFAGKSGSAADTVAQNPENPPSSEVPANPAPGSEMPGTPGTGDGTTPGTGSETPNTDNPASETPINNPGGNETPGQTPGTSGQTPGTTPGTGQTPGTTPECSKSKSCPPPSTCTPGLNCPDNGGEDPTQNDSGQNDSPGQN